MEYSSTIDILILTSNYNLYILEQQQMITNISIITTDQIPLQRCLVEESHLIEAVVCFVQHSRDVAQSLPTAELTVAVDVACHAVDNMRR